MRNVPILACLIFAAGALFPLPFLRQAYCDVMLKALGVGPGELGLMNSAYGFAALLCYVPGGWLADRFPPRRLVVLSLLGTGASGLWFATFPALPAAVLIHALWGVLCVLTFWAPMLKMASAVGGEEHQSRAFGLLDGGRGLIEGLFALAVLALFARHADAARGLASVVGFYAIACFVAAAVVLVVVPKDFGVSVAPSAVVIGDIGKVARLPFVWLVGALIGCAYTCFWGTFDLPSYSIAAFGGTEVSGAELGTFRMWFRPVAGLGVCLFAHRFSKTSLLLAGFGGLGAGYLWLALTPGSPSLMGVLWLDTALLALCVFLLKAIYFTLVTESEVPRHLVGTAIGLVSLVGYLPDMLMPLVMGWLPHRSLYAAMALAASLGAVATLAVARRSAVSECALPAA